MLYRGIIDRPELPLIGNGTVGQRDRIVGGAGGPGRLIWLRGEHAMEKCPVCSNPGPHRLQVSVPSAITAGVQIIFARCRGCDCRFVMDYQPPAYEAAPSSPAPLHFYVEQGAGIEFLARPLFVAAQHRAVRNYLDVGCGFGFGPDMAARMFGWNALGLDPGLLAAKGREMLGIRIENDELSTEHRLAEAPYDAIAAMEVVEHIVDPHSFLGAVRNNLAESGIFVLSTPNGRYLDSFSDGGMLMPILSPGYHAVLYTAEGLGTLLRNAGFTNVNVTETSTTLFAAASRSDGPLHIETKVNRTRYLEYLRSRFHDSVRGSPVHTGCGYRLLRALTEDRAFQEALVIVGELREATLTRFGIDLDRPLDVAGKVLDQEVAFADVPARFPFCLAGLLYCRGTVAASYQQNPDLATTCFLAARFAAQMLLRSLTAIGIGDGELAALPALAADAMKRLL